MQPIRIHRKRIKGWKMPENTIYVGRPSKFGNPFKVIEDDGLFKISAPSFVFQQVVKSNCPDYYNSRLDALADCVKCFDLICNNSNVLFMITKELKGKNLACFCKLGEPCHADVLLRLAN